MLYKVTTLNRSVPNFFFPGKDTLELFRPLTHLEDEDPEVVSGNQVRVVSFQFLYLDRLPFHLVTDLKKWQFLSRKM